MDKTGCVLAKESLFVWEINNFSNIRKNVGEYIESPFFTAGELSSNIIRWKLIVYPSGLTDEYKDFVSLYLIIIFCGDIDECNASYSCYLWNNEEGSRIDSTQKFTSLQPRSGIATFINSKTNEYQNHLIENNNALKIACKICNLTVHFANKSNHRTELMETFDPLYLSDNFSDVIIEVDDKKIKAHKNILALKSEVFSAMFKHNTVESANSIVQITDISYEVMKELLRFIYCGRVENIQIHAIDLLAAADKYNLILLKKICEQALWNNINATNVCKYISISDLYQCDALKAKAFRFVLENEKKVVETPAFEELGKTYPIILLELFRALVKKNSS